MSKNSFSEENFWRKLRRYFGKLTRPALVELLSLYYCLQDNENQTNQDDSEDGN